MAGHGVDPAGDADTDGVEVVAGDAGGRERLIERCGDRGRGRPLVTDRGRVGGAATDDAVGIDDEDRDLGATDVDAGDEAGAGSPARAVTGIPPSPLIDAPSGRARG